MPLFTARPATLRLRQLITSSIGIVTEFDFLLRLALLAALASLASLAAVSGAWIASVDC